MNKKILIVLLVAIFIMTGCNHNKAEESKETKTENSSNELVLRDNQIISGLEAWENFLQKTEANQGQPAEITIKDCNTYAGENPVVITSVLKYDGREYSISDNIMEERSYKYLVKRDGDSTNDEYTVYGYYLTNDKEVTYKDLMINIYASSSYEQIKYCEVFSVMEENQLKSSLKEPSVVKTYEVTDSNLAQESLDNDELITMVKYYEMSDGTWKTDDYTYQYRLEITGRLNNAIKDSTFVFLSNIKDITFEQAWKASGLSSNMNDYFKEEDARLVAMK